MSNLARSNSLPAARGRGSRAFSMPPDKHLGLGIMLPDPPEPAPSIKDISSGSITGKHRFPPSISEFEDGRYSGFSFRLSTVFVELPSVLVCFRASEYHPSVSDPEFSKPDPVSANKYRNRTMPVAASAIYFLNLRGDVLINRLYRDDVGGNMVDAFRVHIMQTKELGTCPVRQIGGCSFFYMRISNVYIVIVVSSNANVACAFKFVVEAVTLFKSYFGGAFDEDAIRNNFVLIYELLDEIMDFGYPQNLSPEILKLYITQEGVRSPFSSKAADKPVPNATLQVTGAVGWRREGLVYKKNEVFLDIVESVNLLMSSKGSVLRCDVTGKILMKCFLSGMPDLKLGLNDKIGLEKESQLKSRPAKSGKTIELDDVTFHQCVNLTRFNSEKTVSFVPPDGEFELMKYRITEGVNLPFRVLPTIKELGRTRMEVNVKVKSVFGAKMFALGVVVKIPVPKQTAKTSFQVTSGRAKYSPSIDCLVWKIRKFPGQTEPTLSAEVELISTMTEKKSWTRPPIQMEFQVPMFTASGLRVRFLKVWEKSGYNTVEWVRYITKAGSYEVRC
ncbi:AP-2 complex subunit mu [Striga hermonthica]|uniref:AP-2 complex subunit mu n=1 Tax=Striga hermonthica TaxID=68872 RepID=A0A9N7P1X5_STRHE|nr:AP-2 complex subunit mu [Striga hermonthica]